MPVNPFNKLILQALTHPIDDVMFILNHVGSNV